MKRTRSLGGAPLSVSTAPLALMVVVLLAVAVQPADAYSGYKHSTATSCTGCHPGGDTSVL
jgi:hypothetical protein